MSIWPAKDVAYLLERVQAPNVVVAVEPIVQTAESEKLHLGKPQEASVGY